MMIKATLSVLLLAIPVFSFAQLQLPDDEEKTPRFVRVVKKLKTLCVFYDSDTVGLRRDQGQLKSKDCGEADNKIIIRAHLLKGICTFYEERLEGQSLGCSFDVVNQQRDEKIQRKSMNFSDEFHRKEWRNLMAGKPVNSYLLVILDDILETGGSGDPEETGSAARPKGAALVVAPPLSIPKVGDLLKNVTATDAPSQFDSSTENTR